MVGTCHTVSRLLHSTMLEKNGRIKAPSSGGMSIKDRRLQNMQEFMAGSGGVSFLRRSHYGQKLLRLAELAAIRHFRNADTVQDFKGQLKTVKQGGRVTPKNGSFAYGFQTGTLAGAWFNNQAVFRNKAGGGIQISILPKKNSGGIAPLWLTGILKKNIQKQGGDPRLLKPAGARRVVRLALKAMSGSGMEGVRLK